MLGGGGASSSAFGVSGDGGMGTAGTGDAGDSDPASPDEFFAFLQQYTAMGGSLDPESAPPELAGVLKSLTDGAGGVDVLKEMLLAGTGGAAAFANAMGGDVSNGGMPSNGQMPGVPSYSGTAPLPKTDREEINPESGFVVKTVNDAGRKVFINVCGHFKIQQPGSDWANGKVPKEVDTALANLEDPESVQHLRFPLSVSDARNELDKKGTPCTVYDAVFNLDVVKQAMVTRRLKVFLVELVLQWIGQKYSQNLDAQYKLPHRRYVGGDDSNLNPKPIPQWIRVDKKSMIEEIDTPDDEVVFPLRPRRSEKQVRVEAAAREEKLLLEKKKKETKNVTTGSGTSTGLSPQNSTLGDESASLTQKLSSFAFDGLPEVTYELSFTGKPVTSVMCSIKIPENINLENVKVHCVTEGVTVDMPGHKQTRVQFPFAVEGSTATCEFYEEKRIVTFEAKYTPYDQLVAAHVEKSAKVKSQDLKKLSAGFLDV